MKNIKEPCIHIIAAKKFLLDFLKLPLSIFNDEYDICYNNECNNQITNNKMCFGVTKKEYEIPMGFIGIGLLQNKNIPFEIKKILESKNEINNFNIDKRLSDIGEPTYREINIKEDINKSNIKELLINNINNIKYEIDNKTKKLKYDYEENIENLDNNSLNNIDIDKNLILEWFKNNKPIWDEDNNYIINGIFKSTPDWKRLIFYGDDLSCEWGSAKVILLMQFWQTSLSYTDRIINNKDLSIIEYIGGNEESCLPFRLLIKFERKNTNIREDIRNNISNKELIIENDFEAKNNIKIKNNLEIKDNIKFIDMVKYIQDKNFYKEYDNLKNKYKNLDKNSCFLYINDYNDFDLKLQIKYDKDIIKMIKSYIKGRKYDHKNKLWLLPIESIYESVIMIEFLGGYIDDKVILLLINGNNYIVNNLHNNNFCGNNMHVNNGINNHNYNNIYLSYNELPKWKNYLPKTSCNSYYRYRIRFNIKNIMNINNSILNNNMNDSFYLSLNKEYINEDYSNELIKILRNNSILLKWDEKENYWKLNINQFIKVINIFKTNFEFHFSTISDKYIYDYIAELFKKNDFQIKIQNLCRVNNNKKWKTSIDDIKDKSEYLDRDRYKCQSKYKNQSQDVNEDLDLDLDEDEGLDEDEYMNEDKDEYECRKKVNQVLILTCLGKDDYDNKRLQTKIENMIKEIKKPEFIDNIKFVMWPKHYKEWESISFLIISNNNKLNNYHPKLLLSLVSNVMIVSENMIDYVIQKNTWPNNSFETKFELIKNLPSLESRLYINEGIFCQTKLFIVGPLTNNHFKLCTRLATLGNASFVKDPLLADYIVICDENDLNALEIKKSVPKKQASKVQNTHGETHSIQVTPKWVYDVVLEFTIIKPTSKRNHKAWMNE